MTRALATSSTVRPSGLSRRECLLAFGGLAAACAPVASGSPTAAQAPSAPLSAAHATFFDVREFGAVADGKTKCTEAVRRAIEQASQTGGGTILFSGGDYLTGRILLKSNIALCIDTGTRLKFSSDFDDYLPRVRMRWEGTEIKNFSPLIYAEKAENIAIYGRGVLDGQGEAWWQYIRELKQDFKKTGKWRVDSKWQRDFLAENQQLETELPDDPSTLHMGFLRPPFIQPVDCKNVSIRDVTIVNSPFWNINPVYCDDVTVVGVTIQNPDDAPNTDGIDPDSCKNVHISDCHISVGDDCICIKSGRDKQGRRINRPAENHTISNCTMLRGHGGVVIGSEMSGGAKKITISNCVFDGTDRGIRIKSTRGRGGVIEDVRVDNIVMKNIREEAITLNMFYTDAPPEPFSARTPVFRNIHISAISGQGKQAGLLLGLAESPLEDVTLRDIDLQTEIGMVIRDARRIALSDVRVDASSGPALIAERCETLTLSDVGTNTPHPAVPTLKLSNVQDTFVHDCRAATKTDIFLEIDGKDTRTVHVADSELSNAKVALAVGKDVPAHAVTQRLEGGR
ncbi:MAG TPA: glycoside hydrolase family 28 protein [Polyangiaceae bacterium]|jgi:polygalacturonase